MIIVENADNSTFFFKIDTFKLRKMNMEKKSRTRSFYRWVDDVSQDYSQDSLCGFLDPDSPEAKKNDGTIIQVTWPEKTNGQTYKYPARKETHEVKNFNLRIFSHYLGIHSAARTRKTGFYSCRKTKLESVLSFKRRVCWNSS